MSSVNRGADRIHTMTCDSVRATLSDFVENNLSPTERESVELHLNGCEGCRHEARQFQSLLTLLQERIPAREPSLDIWAELSPKIEAIRAEERLGIAARMKLRSGRFLGNFAAGAILFTQALAMNTQRRMQKYLIADPFMLGREEA